MGLPALCYMASNKLNYNRPRVRARGHRQEIIMRHNIFTLTLKENHPIQYYLARSFGVLIGIILSPILLPLALYFTYRVNKNIKEHIETL